MPSSLWSGISYRKPEYESIEMYAPTRKSAVMRKQLLGKARADDSLPKVGINGTEDAAGDVISRVDSIIAAATTSTLTLARPAWICRANEAT